MDDGEIDLANDMFMSSINLSGDIDEIMRSSSGTCTHTHTCNPPGPDVFGHTHTCYHTHTRVIATTDAGGGDEDEAKTTRRPLGNREAVRKYREKKKAHTAYLEEEVKKLRQLNQQLLKKLQGQAALESEVQRLRALLADIRGKIDSEIGIFPFQKQCGGAGIQCDAYVQCGGASRRKAGWEEICEPQVFVRQDDANCDVLRFGKTKDANSLEVGGSFITSGS